MTSLKLIALPNLCLWADHSICDSVVCAETQHSVSSTLSYIAMKLLYYCFKTHFVVMIAVIDQVG